MKQQRLNLAWGLTNGPQAVATQIVNNCTSVKDATRKAFAMRRIKGMTQSHLAAVGGFYAPHVSLWLSKNDERADIPVKHIAMFCWAVGNTLLAQYIAAQVELTVMEEVQANIQAEREAA